MQEEKAREWEKGTAEPIPFNKYEKFKEKLAAYSTRYRERNLMLFILDKDEEINYNTQLNFELSE